MTDPSEYEITIDDLFKEIDRALKTHGRKCLVLTSKDYEAMKKHLQEVSEMPSDKQIGTLKSINGINVYLDDSMPCSSAIHEDFYLEIKRILNTQNIILPLPQNKRP